MQIKEILQQVDHTLLATTATWQQIRELCDEAIRYQTASVCIAPSFVPQAVEYIAGRTKVCTVIGFPNGYHTTAVKVFEANEAIQAGADELDMVINIGWLKDGLDQLVEQEIRAVKQACAGRTLKVIVETCLLNEQEKVRACEIVNRSGADFIKTSTGFSTGGATPQDVELFAKHVAAHVKIKAAGGIRSLEDAKQFITLGASRLGTSSIVKLAKGMQTTGY